VDPGFQALLKPHLSVSVQSVVSALGAAPVSSWEVVKTLLAQHKEYGEKQGSTIARKPGPAPAQEQPAAVWVDRVRGLLNPTVKELHGRLLVLGLARLDPGLDAYLRAEGFLRAIEKELSESVDTQFQSDVSRHGGVADPAVFHADGPAIEDALGRRGFAAALAVRLRRIWREHVEGRGTSSFVIHVHGPWGSGKTSLLGMLGDALQQSSTTDTHDRVTHRDSWTASRAASPWIVVPFNAWQQQRIDPPWWALLQTVCRSSKAQLLQRSPVRAVTLHLREKIWRVTTMRRDVIAIAALVILLAGAGYVVVGVYERGILSWLKGVKLGDLKDAIAITSAVLSAFVLIGRSLVSGSSRAAQTFLEAAGDPMDRVSRHFRSLVRHIDRPVLVIVDDLDRCHSPYVVRLLEGIQTLFADPRVVYVIAADREWLYSCFEQGFAPFVPALHTPGRGLGSLFLEKIFQLSVSVPRLAPDLQKTFWEGLIMARASTPQKRLDTIHEEVRREFAKIRTEAGIFDRLRVAADDPVRRQLVRQVAIERLADSRVEESTTHFLAPFSPLVEPNPRAMKRLLNAYAMQRDLAVLGGVDVLSDVSRRKQLVLWTILCLRWPTLERRFLEQAAGLATAAPADSELDRLLQSEPVKDVLDGTGVGVTLDPETISLLAGLRSAHSGTSGAVA
jgi:hypothetical protein